MIINNKNGLILPTGQWYAPSAVINGALIMHYLAQSCTNLPYTAQRAMIHPISSY